MYALLVQIAILVAVTHGLRAPGPPGRPAPLWPAARVAQFDDPDAPVLRVRARHRRGAGRGRIQPPRSGRRGDAAPGLCPCDARRIAAAPGTGVGRRRVSRDRFRIRIFADTGAGACLGLSVTGVLAACSLAARLRIAAGASLPGAGTWLRPRGLALGTAVPATLVVAVKMVGVVGGVDWAGRFATFPGMSLAVLVVTHLEAGPAAACRMAKSMPPGNLITIGFLAAFRLVGARLGLGWGTACGYAVALATLLALEGLVRSAGTPAHPHRRSAPGFVPIPWLGRPSARGVPASLPGSSLGRGSTAGRRPRHRMEFSPRIEPFP